MTAHAIEQFRVRRVKLDDMITKLSVRHKLGDTGVPSVIWMTYRIVAESAYEADAIHRSRIGSPTGS